MSEGRMEPDNKVVVEITRAHLKANEPECRWCFAVDMQRIPGKIKAKYCFPDGLLLHLSCPRCGGEFTYYSEGWEEDYLKNIIMKLHPEFGCEIDKELLDRTNSLVFPEYLNV